MMSVSLWVSIAVLNAPPATLLSDPSEEAQHLRFLEEDYLVTWEVVTANGREVRRYSLSRGHDLPIPGADSITRAYASTKDRRKPLLNQWTSDGRWVLHIGGRAPAAPSAASDIHGELSPDRSQLAFASGRSGAGDIYVTEARRTHQSPRRLTTHESPEFAPRWSPDGGSLAFIRATARGRQLQLLSSVSSSEAGSERTLSDERDGVLSFSWRPDGEQLAFFGRDWNVGVGLFRVDRTLGAAQRVLTDVQPQQGGPAWITDGNGGHLLLTIRNDQIVAITPAGEETVLETGTFGNMEVTGGVFRTKRVLLIIALGVQGNEAVDVSRTRVFQWQWP